MPYTEEDQKLQIMLEYLGYNVGSIDGIGGKNTAKAISQYQENAGLDVTGEADQETVDTLYAEFVAGNYTASGIVLQLLLHFAGYDVGTMDGIIGRNTKNALKEFQADNDIDESGELCSDSIAALKENLYA
jgi:peptidoglycan hydrolase-like protein with peptidoglycan-binding domain